VSQPSATATSSAGYADVVGLKMALLVPAVCYFGILCYGIYARRARDAA